VLRQKLAETADLMSRPCDAVMRLLSSSKTALENREIVPGNEQKSGLVEQEDGVSLVVDAKVKLEEEVPESCSVVETAVDGGSEGTMDFEEDQLGLMTCSLSSATSGFDDNSCASSVVGGDEMPSEETWNFDVHEETCREPAATAPANSDGEDFQQTGGTPVRPMMITEEQVKQMEKIWLSRMEKLERRLMQAVEGEQRARDQIALLGEEKNRRIAALERQVDMLEADDFRLTKTIHTLEQLERVFRAHFISAVDDVESRHLHGGKDTDACASVVEPEDKNCSDQTKIDQVKESIEETGIDDIVGHPCCDKTCLQCHACQTLKSTIELLHSALAEQSAVDRRVRELEEGMKGSQSVTSDDQAGLEVVDFEAEYRELEALVRELKQVLVVDRSAEGYPVIKDSVPNLCESKEDERQDRKALSLSLHWSLDDGVDDDDETVSMVTTPDIEIDAPALKALKERNRELEISEQYLRQQVNSQFACFLFSFPSSHSTT